MSVPNGISTQDDAFLSNYQLAQNLDFTYLHSIKDTQTKSTMEHLTFMNPEIDKQQITFETFNNLIPMKSDTFEQIYEKNLVQNEEIQRLQTQCLINQSIAYHKKDAQQIKQSLQRNLSDPFNIAAEYQSCIEDVKDHASTSWNFDKIQGNNPSKWPIDQSEFINIIKEKTLSDQQFFMEPNYLHTQFYEKAHEVVREVVQKLSALQERSHSCDTSHFTLLLDTMEAIFLVSLNKGSFIEMLRYIQLLKSMEEQLTEEERAKICEMLKNRVQPLFQEVMNQKQKSPPYHYFKRISDYGGFKIQSVQHFQKQNFQSTSMTTDGIYLYIIVSACNGGMYKIGTGEGGSIAGKVYKYAAVSKQDEICWVYLKEKLYLRSSQKEFGTLEIICPQTLKSEGMIQLHCPEIFGHPSLQLINKNYPLLTDGQYLYIIGKKITQEKLEIEELKQDQEVLKRKIEQLKKIKEQKSVEKSKAPQESVDNKHLKSSEKQSKSQQKANEKEPHSPKDITPEKKIKTPEKKDKSIKKKEPQIEGQIKSELQAEKTPPKDAESNKQPDEKVPVNIPSQIEQKMPKEQKEPKQAKESKPPKQKQPKIPKQPKVQKTQQDQKEENIPKEQKDQKEKKEEKDSPVEKDQNEQKDSKLEKEKEKKDDTVEKDSKEKPEQCPNEPHLKQENQPVEFFKQLSIQNQSEEQNIKEGSWQQQIGQQQIKSEENLEKPATEPKQQNIPKPASPLHFRYSSIKGDQNDSQGRDSIN